MHCTVAIALAMCFVAPTLAWGDSSALVQGVVYHDRNHNAVQDRFEFGVRGVAVSNGREVAVTDWKGRYRIAARPGQTLFVIKPGGFRTAIDADQIPRFYTEVAEPPQSYDFPLYQQRESRRFRAIVFGDPQVSTPAELAWLARDVIAELIGSTAAFGISLGDLVGDDLTLLAPLKRVVARIGVPWYNVIGNHDLDYDAADDAESTATFERVYGPTDYAFVYGRVHFIVLDDVVYAGATADGKPGGYAGGLNTRQLAFVANYLATVPRDRLVVFAVHIPFDSKPYAVEGHLELFALLRDRPNTLSLAAHMHFQKNQFFGPDDGFDGAEPHHQFIAATTSGSWWLGAPDEVGIPHATMRCGAPNGYNVITFDGDRYQIRFKAARRPADYQMNIYAPDVVRAGETGDTEVLVNVFGGSEHTRVEMRFGEHSDWATLSKVARRDPAYVAVSERDQLREPRPRFFVPPPMKSPHIWAANLPADSAPGAYTLEVRSVDRYGQVFRARRPIRIVR